MSRNFARGFANKRGFPANSGGNVPACEGAHRSRLDMCRRLSMARETGVNITSVGSGVSFLTWPRLAYDRPFRARLFF